VRPCDTVSPSAFLRLAIPVGQDGGPPQICAVCEAGFFLLRESFTWCEIIAIFAHL